MAHNNEHLVRAIIPHPEEHDTYIVSEAGDYPQAVFHPDHRTYEGTLDRIGRSLGAKVLSPDYRIPDNEDILYRTKPIHIELAPGYRWQHIDSK